jgi:hypothetical protein
LEVWRNPPLVPAADFFRHQWQNCRDRRLWLSARALVLNSGFQEEPLAIRDMRRLSTAGGGLVFSSRRGDIGSSKEARK